MVIYCTNEICEVIDGISNIVTVDYYLVNDDEGEPLTDKELEKALEDMMLSHYLTIEDKKENIEYHLMEG